MKSIFITLIFVAIAVSANAQKLDKFGMEAGKKSVMGKEVRIPYTDVISYYGYIKPGAAPDEVKNGKKMYYLYVWIPAVATEIGIRMASPVPAKMAPAATDFIGTDYTANASDATNYFDTWITLEKAEGISSVEKIAGAKTAKWNTIESNDDSGEMPAQPSGSNYNSLMRVTSEVSNPLKALTVGLYRVGFTTYKTGEVQGSFVAQLAAPVKLPGVAVASNIADLQKQLAKK